MQQQLPPPRRLVVLTISMRILADMRIQQPSFISSHFRKAVLQLDFTVLSGLHFCSGKRQSSLETLQQVVIVPGLPVVAQDFDSRLHGFQVCTQRAESTLRQAFMWCSVLLMVSNNAA